MGEPDIVLDLRFGRKGLANGLRSVGGFKREIVILILSTVFLAPVVLFNLLSLSQPGRSSSSASVVVDKELVETTLYDADGITPIGKVNLPKRDGTPDIQTPPDPESPVRKSSSLDLPLALGSMAALIVLAGFCLFLPSKLRVNIEGLCLEWPFGKRSGRIGWSSVESISIENPGPFSLDKRSWVVFRAADRIVRVDVDEILSCSQKARLAEMVERRAREHCASVEVLELLRGAASASYTELWLQTLGSSSARRNSAELMPGDLLDREKNGFEILERLGTGGQGSAYKACSKSGELFVLKEFILPASGDPEIQRTALSRFVNEADILAVLDHPQIVRLHGYFFEDHRGYLILELAKGKSLRRHVAESGPLPTETIVSLAAQMCEILGYLHMRTPPVVHRDFTPDNLVFAADDENQLVLVDFNVARSSDSSFTGTVVGKQSYIALEQLRGHATTGSDIYAMGATLFFLLTGHDPEPLTPSDPRLERADTPEPLGQLVLEMMAIDPADRLESIAHAAERLNQIGSVKLSLKSRKEEQQT